MLSWLPDNVSTYGADIDALFALIYYITGIAFLLTQGTLLLFLFLYRRQRGQRATYVAGNRWGELTWILVPCALVLVLDLWIDARGTETWNKVKGQVPPADLQVRVIGKQFNWEMVYPGPDGQFSTEDDLVVENELHVPTEKVVEVMLESRDVIHSFFLPHLRLKQDAVPGRKIPAWFVATKPGRYEIPCAELCGFGHSGMNGSLIVHTPEEYQQWVQERWPSTMNGQHSAASGQLKEGKTITTEGAGH
jgi:cytochrome c oxidase subunit 2